MTDLYFYQLPPKTDWAHHEPLLSYISEERAARILRMPSVPGKILHLYAELLLRRIACEQLAVDNDSLCFAATEHGKPYLVGHEDFFFNWSHTKDALAIAVSDDPVGVDIERLMPRGDACRLAQRFFTEKEASYVSEEASLSDLRFCEVWTRKEAYTKYTGSGLTAALNSFDVLNDPDIASRLTTLRHGGHMLSLCADSGEFLSYFIN